jgi:hypothetical protein
MTIYDPIFTRDDLNERFSITLTDNQWSIILAEVSERDPDEDGWLVIEDVCQNLESYEQEYSAWNHSIATI